MTKPELPSMRRRKACGGKNAPQGGGASGHAIEIISPFGGPDGELTAKR